ncbi:MAG: energy-coupling factor ABC transporter permease [Ignisphaera sp.]|nr:energy-coupling factor ABC transporter permease [Ignisphaera sp.]MDW8086149.1 energy-coupling factor ABC transporter permease [Ignisphaera sp.]
MHIPDGLLDPGTVVVTYVAAVAAIALSIARVRRSVSEFELSKLATVSGSIFIAQLIKWPIPGGSTLHFVGGGLAAATLGPWGGLIAMATVLAIQTFVFHDGGVTAFGANVIAAGASGVWLSYLALLALRRIGLAVPISAFSVGYISTVATGFAAGLIIGVAGDVLGSSVYNLRITPHVMLLTHGLLGLLEGVITMGIVAYLYRKQPTLLYEGARA